jgi:hypothetical protein
VSAAGRVRGAGGHGRPFGLRSAGEAHTGLVVFVQRSDGALRLNVHLHVLALDGAYVRNARNADGPLEFRALPPPTQEEVRRVAERMHGRLERLCAKHGVAGMAGTAGDAHGDGCAAEESQTALGVCMEAASRDVSLFGERAGERSAALLLRTRGRRPAVLAVQEVRLR